MNSDAKEKREHERFVKRLERRIARAIYAHEVQTYINTKINKKRRKREGIGMFMADFPPEFIYLLPAYVAMKYRYALNAQPRGVE